ncbi:MAG: hypothetical protein DMD40_16020 [Gemmatimonadetes bacterium]|nr:MAG: hypothetical protein DMD40_16020 [Gemmatimonadota bacterium]
MRRTIVTLPTLLLLFLLESLLNGAYLRAQGRVGPMRPSMPSPTAATFGKFGDIPVSMYTGTPEIGVPLFTVKGKTLQLPIALSYHASGIKVDEIGGWVGMGWTLDAGGVITRTVRGLVDEQNYGYYREGHTFYDNTHWPTPPREIFINLAQGVLDGEPDQFFFNFAGMSGEFVAGPTSTDPNHKEYATIPYRNWRIEPTLGGPGFASWVITTEDGTRYTFAAAETSRDWWWIAGGDMGVNQPDYYSSWYLTKIKAISGDSIVFSYASYNVEHYRGLRREAYDDTYGSCPGLPPFGLPFDAQSQSYLTEQQLVSITTTGQTITFGTDTRTDAISPHEIFWLSRGVDQPQEPRLLRITITNTADGAIIRRFSFAYDYSIGNRLTLLNVFEEDPAGNQLPPYSFTYSGPALPPRATWYYQYYNGAVKFPIDHWGYYNGKNNDTPIPPGWSPAILPFNHKYFPGADRKPDGTFMQAGTLTKITYPTGGFNEFTYEPNDYSTVVDGSPLFDETPPQNAQHITNHDGFHTNPFTIVVPTGDEAKVKVMISFPPWTGPACYDGDPLLQWCPWAEISQQGSQTYIQRWFAHPDGKVKRVNGPGAGEFLLDHSDSLWLSPGDYTVGASDGGNPVTISITASWVNRVGVTKKIAGGLRILRIKTDDGMGHVSIRKFQYLLGDEVRSSGIIGSEPHSDYAYSGTNANGTPCAFYSRASASKIPLGGGPNVNYSDVTELHGESGEDGRTRHTFTAGGDVAPPGTFPYLRRTSNEWKRGQEESLAEYDASVRYQRIALRFYEFPEPAQTTRKFRGVALATLAGVSECGDLDGDGLPDYCIPDATYSAFVVVSGQKLPTSELRYSYDTLGNASISTSTRYTYGNPNHGQLTETAETNSDGVQRITRLKYPADYTMDQAPTPGSEADALSKMADGSATGAHMPGVVIERTVSVKNGTSDKIAEADLTTFKEFLAGQFLPYKHYVLNSPSPIP